MSATKNMTVRKYHNLMYSKGVSQSKGLSVSSKLTGLQMSIKIKRTAVLSQAKGLQRTVIFKMTAQDFHNLKGLSMRITIKTTAGECHNQNYQ